MIKLLLPNWLPNEQPLQPNWILIFFLGLSIALAIATGYFQFAYSQEQKKYLKLEDQYIDLLARFEAITAEQPRE